MTEDDMEPRPRGRGFFGAFRHPAHETEGPGAEPTDSSEAAEPTPPPSTPPIEELEALIQHPSSAAADAEASPPSPTKPAADDPGTAPTPVDAVDLAAEAPITVPATGAAPPEVAVGGPDGFVGTVPPAKAAENRGAPKLRGEPERELASRDAAPPLELPRIIVLANQKGGVGKTTTAVNLGAGLAELGYRVLVVDLDPQGNATTGLGINPRDVESSIYDVIMSGVSPEDCIEPTSLKNLFVLPATIDLAGAEIELVPAFSRELKLKRALDSIKPDYDVILIDCPPSLGLLTINGLAAADDVIVPIQCEYYALEGLGQLLRNVSLVRAGLNPTLDVRGIVLTMYDARTKLADQVETEVRTHFGAKVYQTIVPRTVRLGEAPSFGQPIIVFDPSSRGATAYRDLAKEVSGGATRRSG